MFLQFGIIGNWRTATKFVNPTWRLEESPRCFTMTHFINCGISCAKLNDKYKYVKTSRGTYSNPGLFIQAKKDSKKSFATVPCTNIQIHTAFAPPDKVCEHENMFKIVKYDLIGISYCTVHMHTEDISLK